MTCTICQCPKSTVAYYGQIRGGGVENILECQGCGVKYLKNMREHDYSEGYREKVGNDDLKRHIMGILDIAQPATAISGKVVCDIGCSDGTYLKGISGIAKDVFGIEPNYDQRKSSQFNVYSSIVEAVLQHKGQVDTVTMWHVIEHVQNPVEFLIEVSQLLNKTGKIYLSTPNSNEVLMKLLDSNFASFFYRAWHTHYYDTNSLNNLAFQSHLTPLISLNKHSFGIGNTFGWLKDKKPCGEGILIEPNQHEHIDYLWRAWLEHTGHGDTLYTILQKEVLQ